MRRALVLFAPLLLLPALLAACGGDGDGGTEPPPPPVEAAPDTLRDGVTLMQREEACASPLPCEGWIQVLWDGWLRADPLESAAGADSVLLEPAELEAVREMALEVSMVELFKEGDAGCPTGSLVERLELRNGLDRFATKISGCTSGPGAALRDSLRALAARRLP